MAKQNEVVAEVASMQIEGTGGGDLLIAGIYNSIIPSGKYDAYIYFHDGTMITTRTSGNGRDMSVQQKGNKLNVVIEKYERFEVANVYGVVDWFIVRLDDTKDKYGNTLYYYATKPVEATELELLKEGMLKNTNVRIIGAYNTKDTYVANVLRSVFKPDLYKNYNMSG